jgi:hypothetical protein
VQNIFSSTSDILWKGEIFYCLNTELVPSWLSGTLLLFFYAHNHIWLQILFWWNIVRHFCVYFCFWSIVVIGVRSPNFIWVPCVQQYSLAETLQLPPPPIWAHIRGRYWSAKIDNISLWPPDQSNLFMAGPTSGIGNLVNLKIYPNPPHHSATFQPLQTLPHSRAHETSPVWRPGCKYGIQPGCH